MTGIPSKLFPKPETFGTEPLSNSLDVAMSNILGTYCHKGDWYSLLMRLDEAFLGAFRNLSDLDDMLFGLLVGRAHCAFRGGCMMTMAGHTVEAYMLLRGCIEASLYALHIDANPEMANVWLNRHNGTKSKEACRTNFSAGVMKRTLKAKNAKLHSIASKLYEMTIDLGAHPNERAITGNLNLSKEGNKEVFHLQYVVGNSIQMVHALKTTCEVGACALSILQCARPDYFKQLGIGIRIDEVTEAITRITRGKMASTTGCNDQSECV